MPLTAEAKARRQEIDQLLSAIVKSNPRLDEPLVQKALQFADELHQDQKRSSGEPYILHPLEVAKILAEYKLDTSTIITGLLHDTVEDTRITLQEVEHHFGSEVASLVDGVTKLSKITFQTTEEKQAENFRKMVLAMAKDLRVILVKLADRLHNMRTLQHLAPEKQTIIAQETLDIYAPLANRLGLSSIKRELEDLGLRFTKPEVYYKLVTYVSKKMKEREAYTQDVQNLLIGALKENGYEKAHVSGRPKHFYSIHKKMEKRNLSYDQVYDLTGFRIMVDTVEQCYGVLGLIHSVWTPVPGRFKDYIAIPKANFYQSLHTTIIGPGGERIEVQIRTHEMHETAEKGIAAHWAYKEGVKSDREKESFRWLRRLVEWNQDLKDPNEFLETVKLDLFSEDVYIFTPKGEVMEFPAGSTPLDFAYSVHTDLGHHCIGAKVNGRIVPLKHKLKSGDTVEILSSPSQRPNKDWLKIVRTSRAKTKIRAFIRVEEHSRSMVLGESILDRELKQHDTKTKSLIKEHKNLAKVAESFSLKSIEDLLSAIGYGKVSGRKVVGRLFPKDKESSETTTKETKTAIQQMFEKAATKSKSRDLIKVRGIDDLLIRFAKCCNPVPGDSVVGFITRGRGISVHSAKCQKVFDIDRARMVEIAWDKDRKTSRTVKLRVVCEDRPGLLADMSQAIKKLDVNITNATIGTTKDKKAVCHFTVSVSDATQIRKILSLLDAVPGVISSSRLQKKS